MTETTSGEAAHRRMPLHTKILIGLIVGVVAGLIAHSVGSCEKGLERDLDSNGKIEGYEYYLSDTNSNQVVGWLDDLIYWVEPIGKVFSARKSRMLSGSVRRVPFASIRTVSLP